MKHNVRQQFDICIPPSPQCNAIENRISEETIAQMDFFHGLNENATSNLEQLMLLETSQNENAKIRDAT